MGNARLAFALIGLGVVMILVGIVDAAGSDSDDAQAVAVATTTIGAVATTDSPPTTSLVPAESPTTTASTVVMTTTTMTSPDATTSTTTEAPTELSETVEDFVVTFAAAIAAGDVDFLLDRLHPAVVGGFGPALCRTWIEGEILLLGDYKLAGPVEGPRDQPFTTPAGTGTISDAFVAPVSFVFQGQSFDGEGGFALVDNDMFWLGQCR